MSLHGSVGRLIFVYARGGDQNGGHHGKGAEGGRNHIAHHVPVIVLAGPDEAALRFHDAGDDVIDQAVEIGQAQRVELLLIFLFIGLLENILEGMVIFLGNGILASEPEILLRAHRILEAGAGKAADGCLRVVHTLQDAGTLKIKNGLPLFVSVLICENQLCLSGAGNLHFHILIDIAIGVTGNGDRFFPVADAGLDSLHHNGSAEYSAVQNRADGSVGALPHFLQIVFRHTGGIGRDGSALDGDTVFLRSFRGFHGHLVIRFITVRKSQVIVFRVQLDKRGKQLLLDHLPQNSGHLVSVHFHQRRCHFDFFHSFLHFEAFLRSSGIFRFLVGFV